MLIAYYLGVSGLFIAALISQMDWTGELDIMTKSDFNALANESLIFAQVRAESRGISRAQVDLWTASFRGKSSEFNQNARTGQLALVRTNQLTNKKAA